MQTELNSSSFISYESWDLMPLSYGERLKFLPLQPIGIGSLEVESLSGYISRLAFEHCITPTILLKLLNGGRGSLPKCVSNAEISAVTGRILNGISSVSRKIIDSLQLANDNSNLFHTTLNPWEKILSIHSLMRNIRAWCPACYQNCLVKGLPVYEKLSWTINAVEVCSIHNRSLETKCPKCHKQQKLIGGKSRPGYCFICLNWLGSFQTATTIQASDNNEFNVKLWKSNEITNLLARSLQFEALDRPYEKFISNLEFVIKGTTNGNIREFSRLTNIWTAIIRSLLRKKSLPSINGLLKIGYASGISIVDLIFQTPLLTKEKAETINSSPRRVIVRKKHRLSSTELEKISILLKQYLCESPPPSASEVSRRIGCTVDTLSKYFPKIYEQIVYNYREYVVPQIPHSKIKKMLVDCLNRKQPISLTAAFNHIGIVKTGYYERKFSVICKQISNRHIEFKRWRFNISEAQGTMEKALTENPPPSFSEVSKRLQKTKETLRRNLPELSKKIVERRKKYQKQMVNQRRQEISKQIKRILKSLQKDNIRITHKKVWKLLSVKCEFSIFAEILRQAKKEL
jgi:hypothetical protein